MKRLAAIKGRAEAATAKCYGGRKHGQVIIDEKLSSLDLFRQAMGSPKVAIEPSTNDHVADAMIYFSQRESAGLVNAAWESETGTEVFNKLCERFLPTETSPIEHMIKAGQWNEWDITVPVDIVESLTPDTAPELEDRLRRALAILKGEGK